MVNPHTHCPRSRTSTAIFIAFLISIATAAAIGIARFTSWDDLAQNSPDIIIARCTETPKSGGVVNGMIWADIEVVSVLKGNTKPGAARMIEVAVCHEHVRDARGRQVRGLQSLVHGEVSEAGVDHQRRFTGKDERAVAFTAAGENLESH